MASTQRWPPSYKFKKRDLNGSFHSCANKHLLLATRKLQRKDLLILGGIEPGLDSDRPPTPLQPLVQLRDHSMNTESASLLSASKV